MAYKEVTVPVDGVDTTFNNNPYDAATNPHGLPNGGWRQGDNLFNLLLGILAAASPALKDTSNTNDVAIGLGAKTLAAVNGRPTPVGMPCYAFDAADAGNFIWGRITANAATAGGNITIDATVKAGGGTPASWIIQPSGEQGPADDYWNAETTVTTGTATPVTKDILLCRTSTGAIGVTLPASGRVLVDDVDGQSATHNITVTPPAGHSIMDGAANETFIIDKAFFTAVFRNRPGSTNWSVE